MSVGHEYPSSTSPDDPEERRRREGTYQIPEQHEADAFDPDAKGMFDRLNGGVKLGAAGLALAVAVGGGFAATKIFRGGHDRVSAKRPVATAPVAPGRNHEATPTANPEEGGFDALPALVIDNKTYDGPSREAKIDAASKAFEIPADASPEEATRLLVDRLNTVLNWASDPELDKKYGDFKITETDGSGDPNYKGYGGTAEVREEGLFPAAEAGIVGDWSGGDADGMKDPHEWFDQVKQLSEGVGSHAGTAQANNLPPYSLNFEITPPDASTSAIEVAGYLKGQTDISVFLSTKEKGLEGLQQIQTADGSTIESLKRSGILHFVLQKESDGTQKVVSALFEQTS